MLAACATTPAVPSPPTGPRPCALPELQLTLPFEPNTEHLVVQGNKGSFSHDGRFSFAWDFEMPEGTPVLAAADGVVIETIDGYSEGAPDKTLEERTNKVILDHGATHFSVYQHLQRSGVLVRVGQRIAQGQLIGRSGNTGFTAQPHLHFAVVDPRNRSLPVCFADVEGGVPSEGRSYRRAAVVRQSAGHGLQPVATAPSLLPRDTFGENGILLTTDLPAHLFAGEEKVVGVAVRPATTALAVLATRDRSRQRVVEATIAIDGRFSLVIPRDALEALGPQLDFMLVLVRGDGKWASDFSVPIYYSPADRSGASAQPTAP